MWTTLASSILSSTQNNVQQLDTSKLQISQQSQEDDKRQTYILIGAGVAGLLMLIFIMYQITQKQ